MTLERVKDWLNQMELKFKVLHDNIVILYDVDGIRFAVIINVMGNWIQIAASMVHNDEIPKEKREELLADLLKQNWELHDITYSIDPKGSLFSQNDIPLNSNFENFKSEFGAVVFGVTHFFNKIGPKYGLTEPSIKFGVELKH
ncbi:MAG: YbjN domain-containing protein [Candidatus Hodarchaeota archaeon]